MNANAYYNTIEQIYKHIRGNGTGKEHGVNITHRKRDMVIAF